MPKAKTRTTTRSLPVEMLHEFFEYDPRTGDIFYRPQRARHWFKSDRLWLSWNAQFGGKIAVSKMACGYRVVSVNQVHYLAHRVAWAMMTGEWPREEIDHINGCREDNRWCNLRAATRTQNARNIVMMNTNTSGVTGVHWWETGKLWQVYGGARSNRIVKYAKTFEEAVALREQIKCQLKMTKRHGVDRVS
jgi:hypothetical protein